jgi:hypothetical protein
MASSGGQKKKKKVFFVQGTQLYGHKVGCPKTLRVGRRAVLKKAA